MTEDMISGSMIITPASASMRMPLPSLRMRPCFSWILVARSVNTANRKIASSSSW